MKQKSLVASGLVSEGRVTEGTIVPLTRDLQNRNQAKIDLAKAPVPEKRYTCNLVDVLASETGANFIFGQKKLVGSGLRSLIVVTMQGDALVNFADSIIGFAETRALLEQQGIVDGKLESITEEPAQTVALSASIVYAGYSGRSSCIDFYYASPFSIQEMRQFSQLRVEPVVRVMLSTPLFLAVTTKITEIAKQFRAVIGETDG